MLARTKKRTINKEFGIKEGIETMQTCKKKMQSQFLSFSYFLLGECFVLAFPFVRKMMMSRMTEILLKKYISFLYFIYTRKLENVKLVFVILSHCL